MAAACITHYDSIECFDTVPSLAHATHADDTPSKTTLHSILMGMASGITSMVALQAHYTFTVDDIAWWSGIHIGL